MANNIVRVSIVSYNSAKELKDCINSAKEAILASNNKPSIVVVDNNSTDSSVAVAKECGAVCIENKFNTGFAKATNQGINYLEPGDTKPTYVLILNPDTVMKKESLSSMLNTLVANKDCAAVGPKLITDQKPDSTKDEYYLREPSLLSVLMFSTLLRIIFIRSSFFVNNFYSYATEDKQISVPQIPGACLLTTSEILNKVGLLDEDYAIWFEDVDWSHQARKHRFKLLYCPEAVVTHFGGVSFDKWVSADKSITFFVSMKTFFKKNKPFSYPFVVMFVCLNSIALWIVTRKKSHLTFMKAFLKQDKGLLPN